MSQEGTAEGSCTEDPVLSPQRSCRLFQEDMKEASSGSGLAPHPPKAGSGARVWAGRRKRVLRKAANGSASSKTGSAPGASLEEEAHLVVLELQALGQSQISVPDPKLHVCMPTVPPQGKAWPSKRLQVSLYNILDESWPGNLCSRSVGLPEGALVGRETPAGVEEGSCPRPKEAGEDGRSSQGCDGRSPTLSKEKLLKRDLPSSSGAAPVRARKKSRRREACSEGGEGASDFLGLGQSPGGANPQCVRGPPQGADLESLGGPCSLLSSKDTGSGPEDPGGNFVGCALETEKFKYFPVLGDGAEPGSLYDPIEFLLPSGGESLRPAAQDPPESPASCLGRSVASTEQQEVEHVVGAGGDDGLVISQEELNVKTQPVSRAWAGQGLTAPTDTLASSVEPAASKAHSGLSMGQRRSKCAKLRKGLVLCAQDQGTDRSLDNSNQDQPAESSPGGCPKLVS